MKKYTFGFITTAFCLTVAISNSASAADFGCNSAGPSQICFRVDNTKGSNTINFYPNQFNNACDSWSGTYTPSNSGTYAGNTMGYLLVHNSTPTGCTNVTNGNIKLQKFQGGSCDISYNCTFNGSTTICSLSGSTCTTESINGGVITFRAPS